MTANKDYLDTAKRYFPADFCVAKERELLAIGRAAEPYVPTIDWCYAYLTPDIIEHALQDVLHIIGRAKETFAPILENFPSVTHSDTVASLRELFDVLFPTEESLYFPISEMYRKIGASKDPNTKALEVLDGLRKSRDAHGIRLYHRYSFNDCLEQNGLFDSRVTDPIVLIINPSFQRSSSLDALIDVFEEPNYQRQIGKLSAFCRVATYEVGSSAAAINTIKRVGQKYGTIDYVFFCGHGAPLSLELSDIGSEEERNITISHEQELAQVACYLAPHAKVVLAACQTGKLRNTGNNLANVFSRALPGRTIYAPCEDFYGSKLSIALTSPFDFTLSFGINYKNRDITYIIN